MKELTYRLYGFIFCILKLFPIKKKKVLLYMMHNSNFKDNLKSVYEEMKQRDSSLCFVVISKKELFHCKSNHKILRFMKTIQGTFSFYVVLNYHFATSQYICLNDNFLPLAYMKLKEATKLVQLWHGVGAFKKFGLSTEQDPLVRKLVSKGNQQLDYLFVSSQNNIPCYAQAMGIDKKHIYATGIPVTDYYYQKQNHKNALAKLYHKYPMAKGKKVILYVPTFRKTEAENNAILQKFDTGLLSEALGEEYVIMVRMHPQIQPSSMTMTMDYINVTNYDDVKELYLLADLLITDYSSTVVEYALLDKPMVFYAYDLEEYDRGFYDSYEEYVPGIIARNMEGLTTAITASMARGGNAAFERKREKFLARHYDYLDGKSTQRVVDTMLNQSSIT